MKTSRLEAFSDGVLAIHGRDSTLAQALGTDWKGKSSPVISLTAIGFALISPWLAGAVYVIVALMWLVPDRRIARELEAGKQTPPRTKP